VPACGLFFWGWNTGSIIVLFWFENIIIGLFNAVKMTLSSLGESISENESFTKKKLFHIVFFIFHYGVFCAGHGIFVRLVYKLSGGEMNYTGF